MDKKKILITGGAGFIGSHLTDRLVESGYHVRVFDNLDPQIHPHGRPAYLHPAIEFIEGDVCDRVALAQAVDGVEAVYHFAAAVGTGQSMYQIAKYSEVNIGGLSNLLDILVETKQRPHIIFPGSATSYGECAHRCPEHGLVFPEIRPVEQLRRQQWEIVCPNCQQDMVPVPIPENQPLQPRFVYGLNKKYCEELLVTVAATYDMPYTILRFFNVFGPRQSLSNPYTGVMAIFSSQIKNDHQPLVIEDGKEFRDFISVHDVVKACLLTLEKPSARGQIFNVGTGQPTDIYSLATYLIKLYGKKIEPRINGEFRKNDFRYSLANIDHIKKTLGFEPKVSVMDGLAELTTWAKQEVAVDDLSKAWGEMRQHGIVETSQLPLVTVVTLNWNGYDNTVECVETLQHSTYSRLKIIVVDNGSKNKEAERLAEKFGAAITVVPTGKNLGVCGGNNAGLQAALADPEVKYVIMMNNDLMVEPESIKHLVEIPEVNQRVGMVASRMMNYFDRQLVDNLGIALTTSGLGYNRKSEWYPLFCPCSGYGLYRAEALRKIAMPDGQIWDNDFFAYVDELDVGFRLRMAGYEAAYAARAVAHHKDGAASGGSSSDFSIFHGHRNTPWFIFKDFPASLLWRFGLSILATQIGAIGLYITRGRPRVMIRAKWQALLGLPKMLKKRKMVQAGMRVQPVDLKKLMISKAYIKPEAAQKLPPRVT